MINPGAISVCAHIAPDLNPPSKFKYLVDRLSDLAGGLRVGFSQPTYLCEMETAWRNNALMYFMKQNGVFPSVSVRDINGSLHMPSLMVQDVDPRLVLDFYIQSCSIEVNTDIAACMAATLAKGGVSPLTSQRCFAPQVTKAVLTLMFSCGMYDASGEWSVHVGLPAKSGVAGLIYVVIPNVMGLAVWSPPLDRHGNSVRGVEFCRRLLQVYDFSIFNFLTSNTRTMADLATAASRGPPSARLLSAGGAGNGASLRKIECQRIAGMTQEELEHHANVLQRTFEMASLLLKAMRMIKVIRAKNGLPIRGHQNCGLPEQCLVEFLGGCGLCVNKAYPVLSEAAAPDAGSGHKRRLRGLHSLPAHDHSRGAAQHCAPSIDWAPCHALLPLLQGRNARSI